MATDKAPQVGRDRGSTAGFWPLVYLQAQGAFSDNVYRYLVVFFVIEAGMLREKIAAGAAQALFSIPFVLFPAMAGALGDRVSKRLIGIYTKVWEASVMALGLLGFYLQSAPILLTGLFLMAMQSTFFSPMKYGILPEMLPERRLSWANGIIGVTTFAAIIGGISVAGWLSDLFGEQAYYASFVLIALAVSGLAAGLAVRRVPPADPGIRAPWNPWSGLGRYFRVFLGDKTLFYTEAGLVYFWSAGSLIAANVLVLGKDEFALESDLYVGIMNACLVVGIGLGHMAAGFVSGETINRRLVPYGMFGVAAGCAAMAYPGHTFISSLPVLFVMGFAAGFYAVPLNATLQDRSPRSAKGGMIAASNFINFSGMLLAGGVYFAIGFLDPSSFLVFGVIAAVTVGAAVFITKKLPVGAEETA